MNAATSLYFTHELCERSRMRDSLFIDRILSINSLSEKQHNKKLRSLKTTPFKKWFNDTDELFLYMQ